MITPAQTESLAHSHQIDTFSIMREYLQLVFLSHLYSDKKSAQIYFKGGTAIRLLLHSPRFSEDLDFSTTLSKQTIKQIISSLATKIQSELPSLTLSLLYSGKNGLRYHLKYQPPNFKYPLNIRLDFNFVRAIAQTVVSPLITDFPIGIFPIITHLSGAEILAEKLRALSSRSKGRDCYDTWYLLEKGIRFNQTLLNDKLSEVNLSFDQQTLLAKIRSYSQKTLRLDLAQFLPKSQKQIIPLLPQLLAKKLAQVLI